MRRGRSIIVVMLIIVAFALAGCQSMSSVKPGDGLKATITGKSYDQIWDAAHKVSDEHFEIREVDKARGVIVGERTMTPFGWGAWVGTYITPPTAGARSYTVEVVRRKKAYGEQDWEYKILRDIYRELGLPALDPSRDADPNQPLASAVVSPPTPPADAPPPAAVSPPTVVLPPAVASPSAVLPPSAVVSPSTVPAPQPTAQGDTITTISGVMVKTLRPGTGPAPTAADRVRMHYDGYLLDGTVFDSSIQRGDPVVWPLNGVIRCLTDGVPMMKVGGKSRLLCPPHTAYGDRGKPPLIAPGSVLIFEIELLGIVK